MPRCIARWPISDATPDAFDLVFVDAPFKDDMSAEVLTLLGGFDLVAPGGWIVVRTIEARA